MLEKCVNLWYNSSMNVAIEKTQQNYPAMYQVIGANVGQYYFKEITNADASSKVCLTTKLHGYITNEIKFLVPVFRGDYIFEKRRDKYKSRWVIDVFRIIDFDDSAICPTATIKLIETIDLSELREYKESIRANYKP